MGSHQLNKKELDELVDIVNKHREKTEAELVRIAKDKNPLLQETSTKDAIRRQLELIRDVQAKKVVTERADATVRERLETEVRLKEKGIAEEKAQKLAERLAQAVEKSQTLKDYQKEAEKLLNEVKIDKNSREEIVDEERLETARRLVEEKVEGGD
jgi:hypothetical protein